MRCALVIGAQGALGAAVVKAFGGSGRWNVIGVDVAGTSGDTVGASNVRHFQLSKPVQTIEETQRELLSLLAPDVRLGVVINAAGGWTGGGVGSAETATAVELMLRQSLFSSVAAAHVFAMRAAPGGLLALTGAAAALQPTPGMLGYGTAKAAVHFLCRSVAADASALPADSRVLTVLPATLDTPGNRASMPGADTSTWTPVSDIAKQLLWWSEAVGTAPPSGSLVSVTTQSNKTTFQTVE